MCVQEEDNKKSDEIYRQNGKAKCKDEEEELTDREMQRGERKEKGEKEKS
jgi:hypothetical protein